MNSDIDRSPVVRALACAAIALLLALLVLLGTRGGEAPAKPIQQRISETRGKVNRARAQEGVLSSTIARYGNKIGRLQGEVATLRNREAKVQDVLDGRQNELDQANGELKRERDVLAKLRDRLDRSIDVLEQRLVEIYKSDDPDIVTVILQSDGFADLLERTDYLSRIRDQDARVIGRVRDLRNDQTQSVTRLRTIERRVRAARNVISTKRRELGRTKSSLVSREQALGSVRDKKRTSLTSVRSQRHEYEGELEDLEGQIQKQINNGPGAGGNLPAGPVRGGGNGLIWPVNGPVVSPFGMRWGRLHAGIDIGVSSGTPIRVAKSGTVALMAPTGGYGNYTCVNHGGGFSTCYAHQSAFKTSVGAKVSQGQVIGLVGCTGHCFGPHLHFETRVGGVPKDPMGYL